MVVDHFVRYSGCGSKMFITFLIISGIPPPRPGDELGDGRPNDANDCEIGLNSQLLWPIFQVKKLDPIQSC